MPDMDPRAEFETLQRRAVAEITAQFPITGRQHRLDASEIRIASQEATPDDPHHPDNIAEQLRVKLKGGSWSIPITGKLTLTRIADNAVLDRTRGAVILARLPRITSRYSYIVGGHERQHDSLFRSKARPYHIVAANGDIVGRWNVANGTGFDIVVDPASGRMQMKYRTSHVSLYSVLRALGVTDEDMKRRWGEKVYKNNVVRDILPDLVKLHRTSLKEERGTHKPPPEAELVKYVQALFAGTKLRPDGMRAAFGKEFEFVNAENLMLSADRVLGIARGEQEPDDRQALSAKDFVSTDDFVAEYISRMGKEVQKKIKMNLDRKESISDIFPAGAYSGPINAAFENAQRPEQTNPLTFVSGYTRTTIRGGAFGGVKGDQVNLSQDKLINPTHLGFLDPVQTPEGEDTGIALHLPLGVRRAGRDLTIDAYDVKQKRMRACTPGELERAHVAYPDQVTWEGNTPTPRDPANVVCYAASRHTETRPWSDVQFVLRSARNLFGLSANRIPFLQNDQGNRAQFGAKQQEQAIALKAREAPLVQARSEGGPSYDALIGQLSSTRAPVDGVVKEVKADRVILQPTGASKPLTIHIYDHFPLNGGKTMLHSEAVVKVGQHVKKGDLLADSNYTKNGVYADGLNARVAYVPYHGLNFEDGIVVSESFAKRATSVHLHAESAYVPPGWIVSAARWHDYASPERATAERLAKLGADGIVKVGQVVHHGDVLVAMIAPSGAGTTTTDLSNISRKLVRDYKDKAVYWEHDVPGTVKRIAKEGDRILVHVYTEEPLVVGDKLSGRHGNKGIVSRILPDHEMPHDKEGVPVEMLLNPAGVPSRMNVGQVLETALGKIARKTGKTQYVDNFVAGADYAESVMKKLKEHGLNADGQEELIDPKTKASIGPVYVGYQHMLKLHHVVDKKMTARSYGGGYNPHGAPPSGSGVPGGGQKMDQLTTYALLAHGAVHTLREANTYKSDADQDDVWVAIQSGQPLPAPKTPRVVGHFFDYLRGMGVATHFEAGKYHFAPMTDAQTKKVSNGQIKFADKMLMARGDRTITEAGGLFDPHVTGGLDGKYWSHIELARRIPNPTYERPICRLLGINEKEFAALTGKELVGGRSGFDIINERLSKLDVEKELKEAEALLPKTPMGTRLDQLHQKVKYLRALQRLKITPLEAYTNKLLPVVPPAVRRVSPGLDGSQIVHDLNGLYRAVGQINHQLATVHPSTPPASIHSLHADLYDAVKGLRATGLDLGEGTMRKHHNGLMEMLVGQGGPKTSFFHQNVVGKRQNLSGRSTIVPLPELSIDQIGLPQTMAMEMYRPFITGHLVRSMGYSPLAAAQVVRKGEPAAVQALHEAIKGHPVLMKRDPALHKFSIQAFYPVITPGKAVGLHPLSCGGFNADFDGDSCYARVIVVDSSTPGEYVDGMPHHTCLPTSARTVHIKDFPHLQDTACAKEGGALEFDVPEGVMVPAYRGLGNGAGVVEMRPVTKWSVHPGCAEWVVESRRGRRLVVSEDHSLALLDPDTLEVVRAVPATSGGRCFPVLASVEDSGVRVSPARIDPPRTRANACVSEVPLTREVGWLVGATVGDGWCTAQGQVCLAYGDRDVEVADRWAGTIRTLGDGAMGDIRTPHTFDGHPCVSTRRTLSNTRLARWMEEQIGHGAAEKHLPPGFLAWPLEARRGLFEGLIDTDGTAYWSASGRFGLAYTTISDALANDLSLLAMSLGLIVSETETTRRDKPAYLLTFAVARVQQATWITLTSPQKREALERLWSEVEKAPGHTDFVPMTDRARTEILQALKDAGATRKVDKNAAAFSLYVILRKQEPTLSRESYGRLWEVLSKEELCKDAYLAKWVALCEAPVGWDLVVEAKETGVRRTMYDLTVPDAWTFVTADGAVVWDTMAVYAPVSPEAIEEAKKMVPSASIFSPTHGGLMPVPGQDGLVGLYKMTEWGKPGRGLPTDLAKLTAEMHAGKVDPSTVIPGPGGKDTTVGRLVLNEALPAAMRPHQKLLFDPSFRLDKGGLKSILTEVGKKHQQDYGPTVDAWKDLGNKFSYMKAASFKLSDFADGKHLRDKILAPYIAQDKAVRALNIPKAEKDKKLLEIWFKAQSELKSTLSADYKSTGKNQLYSGWIQSGARGDWTQFGQLVAGAILVTDASNKPVPIPIRRSLGEGLGISDYWTHMHGARKGTLDRASGTSDPGALTKDIMNTSMAMKITGEDCGTTRGVDLPATDADLDGRYTVHAVKLPDGTTWPAKTKLGPEHVKALQAQHVATIEVRTAMHCRQVSGICATCYGSNEYGKLHAVGTNIGVIAGHALGEPVTQLAMKTFHTGGAASSEEGLMDSFKRAKQLFRVPKVLPNQAVLATVAGKVEKIVEDKDLGGHEVWIGGVRHYVPAKRAVKVTVGQTVSPGAILSAGPANPVDLLRLTKDLPHVRNYLAQELTAAYHGGGGNVKRRNVETVVRAMTNVTRVEDPGSHKEYTRGDYAPLSEVLHKNEQAKAAGVEGIRHTPALRPMTELPLIQSEDVLARLNYARLEHTYLEAGAQGWSSDIHGHPIPGIVHGAEFGLAPGAGRAVQDAHPGTNKLPHPVPVAGHALSPPKPAPVPRGAGW